MSEIKNPKVDEFLSNLKKWQEELGLLRKFVFESELNEDLKWGVPCYTYKNGNVIIIHGFKEYCAILFVKGSLLKDPDGVLIQQTENVQAGRQIRFTNLQEIVEKESIIKSYIQEAIEIEKSGLKVEFKKNSELVFREELQAKFDENPDLKAAFDSLTPGRQKAYNYFFTSAKQSATRMQRVEKFIQKILDGKGMDD